MVEPVLAVGLTILGFCLHYFEFIPKIFQKIFKINDKGSLSFVLSQRISGVILFGGIPLLIIIFFLNQSYLEYGLSESISGKTILWTGILSIIVMILSYVNSKRPDNLKVYPQIRSGFWNAGLVSISAISWIIYLFAYEFLFRGFLLFSWKMSFNGWIAVSINVVIYAAVHIPKGKKETLAAIPFGIVLCLLTLWTGTLWIAFFSHCVLALSNEWFSLTAHPEMKFQLKKAS